VSGAEQLLLDSFNARGSAWERWGRLDGDVLSHLVNPHFMGGPRWPGLREAFRVARRPDAVLVASDGLSDPFDPDEGPADVNGFGLECFAVSDSPLQSLPGTWLFSMVWQISQFAASRGDLGSLLEELGLLTTELHGVEIPGEHRDRFVTSEGRVGVIIGMIEDPVPSVIEGPLSRIRLVNVKLLTVDELAFAMDNGDHGRRELCRRFPTPVLASGLSRRSVLEAT
jgi:hypothetical protein